MARYGKAFKARAVARLLPPESATLESVSAEFGIRTETLERWRSEALSDCEDRLWTGPARLAAVLGSGSANCCKPLLAFLLCCIAVLHGPPPKVIWIRLGNCTTQDVAQLLRSRRDSVRSFCQQEELSVLALG